MSKKEGGVAWDRGRSQRYQKGKVTRPHSRCAAGESVVCTQRQLVHSRARRLLPDPIRPGPSNPANLVNAAETQVSAVRFVHIDQLRLPVRPPCPHARARAATVAPPPQQVAQAVRHDGGGLGEDAARRAVELALADRQDEKARPPSRRRLARGDGAAAKLGLAVDKAGVGGRVEGEVSRGRQLEDGGGWRRTEEDGGGWRRTEEDGGG